MRGRGSGEWFESLLFLLVLLFMEMYQNFEFDRGAKEREGC